MNLVKRYSETLSDTVTKEERFVYDGYLCVQRLDATQGNAVRTEFVWDPTEPVATRPLAMRAKNWGLNLFYSHDGNKNVSEVFYPNTTTTPSPSSTTTTATTTQWMVDGCLQMLLKRHRFSCFLITQSTK